MQEYVKKSKKKSGVRQRYFRVAVLFFLLLSVYSCQSGVGSRKFGNALITANISYKTYNGELTGNWSFFQRNQVDSLVPDAQHHDFVINGQVARSEKMKHNYHMYMVADTLSSRTLNVQIGPDKKVISMTIPRIPEIAADTLFTTEDWEVQWDGSGYKAGDSLTLIMSDTEQHTLMQKIAAEEGTLIFPVTSLFNFQPGKGYYYLISSADRVKEIEGTDLQYHIEVYSDDFSLEIMAPEKGS